jgi:hypothetical protein
MRLRAATALLATFTFALGIPGLHAAEEKREQEAHQHGHGTFEMAIEKASVSIDLRVPGDDIVGFEHAPGNAKEKAALEAAKKTLADALGLFGIPKDAACKVDEAKVHTHGFGADNDHDHKHDAKPEKTQGAKSNDGDDHKHGSFHGAYKLTCAKPAAITALNFKFFASFPRSQELEIVAVSEKSQVKAEATRKSPTVSLRGLW